MISQFDVGSEEGMYGRYIADANSVPLFCPIGRDFWIENIELEIERGVVILHLATQYHKRIVRGELLRSELDVVGIKKLMGLGFDIKTASQEIFQQLISMKEDEYFRKNKIHISHINVGWQKIDTEKNFANSESSLGCVYKWFGHIGTLNSDYRGDMDIKPRGTEEGQKNFIIKEIQGNTALEIGIILGLSAVTVGLLGDAVAVPNILVHLFGDSSIGKTTELQLAISVAGVPDLHKSSLMYSWNSTYNALVFRLKGNCGMPIGMDELSKYMGNDFDRLLYTLSDGRDKDRMNRDVTMKIVTANDMFHTTIISTGEASWLNKCKTNNTGLKARIIEINKQFTESAIQADIIKRGVMENCGWLAPALAMHMEKKGMDYLLQRHSYWSKVYGGVTTTNILRDRLSAMYGIILMTAELANEAFGFKFNVDNIIKFFIDNEEQNIIETDIANIAYERLIDFAKSNRSHFNVFVHGTGSTPTTTPNATSNPIYGRIDTGLNKVTPNGRKYVGEFCFTDFYFKNIIHRLGFEDGNVLLKKLKEGGYLNHEKHKTYRNRKLNHNDETSVKMYILYEFEETAEQSLNDTFTEVDDDENPFSEQGKSPS